MQERMVKYIVMDLMVGSKITKGNGRHRKIPGLPQDRQPSRRQGLPDRQLSLRPGQPRGLQPGHPPDRRHAVT